jgi:hypothetical protein
MGVPPADRRGLETAFAPQDRTGGLPIAPAVVCDSITVPSGSKVPAAIPQRPITMAGAWPGIWALQIRRRLLRRSLRPYADTPSAMTSSACARSAPL